MPADDACLEAMAELVPEVILLDIELPGGMDGYSEMGAVLRFTRGRSAAAP